MKFSFLPYFCIVLLMFVFLAFTYSLNRRISLNTILNSVKNITCPLNNIHHQNETATPYPCQYYGPNVLCELNDLDQTMIEAALNTAYFKKLGDITKIFAGNISGIHIPPVKDYHNVICVEYLEEGSLSLYLNILDDLDSEQRQHLLDHIIIQDTSINYDSFNRRVIELEKYKTASKLVLENIDKIFIYYYLSKFHFMQNIINIKNNLEKFLNKSDELLRLLYKRNKNGLYSEYVYTEIDFRNNVNPNATLPKCPIVFTRSKVDDATNDCTVYFSNCLFTFAINNIKPISYNKSESQTLYHKNMIAGSIKYVIQKLNNNYLAADKYPNSALTKYDDIRFIIKNYLRYFFLYEIHERFLDIVVNASTEPITSRVGSTLILVMNLLPDSYTTSYTAKVSYLAGSNLPDE